MNTTSSYMPQAHGFIAVVLLATLTQLVAQPLIDPTNTHLTSWPNYLGVGPAVFPGDAKELTTTCYTGFRALLGSKCTNHVSETLPVHVHNCVQHGASGALVLQRTNETALPASELLGTAMYRLRVLGQDGVWLLDVAYCQPGLAIAPYVLPGPGRYFIEVLMLYTSFSFAAPNTSKAMSAPWAGFLMMDVPVPASETSATPVRTHAIIQSWSSTPPDATALALTPVPFVPDLDAALPLCADNGPLPGRWHFRVWPPAVGSDVSAVAALLRTCIWNDTVNDCRSPDRVPLHFSSFPATLHWRPDGCRMRAIAAITAPPEPAPPPSDDPAEAADVAAADAVSSNASSAAPWYAHPQRDDTLAGANRRGPSLAEPVVEPSTCLPPGRHVCFVGDSHSRYLHNSLVLWRSGYRRAVNNTAKEVLSSSSSRYFRVVFGYDWPEPEPDGADPLARHCTDVVVNFGQWPASYRAGPAPFSAGVYVSQLLRVRNRLLALRRAHGVRVWWLTTCSPSLKAWLEAKGVDWRTDPLLMLYNRLAADVMAGELTPLSMAAPALVAAPAAPAAAAAQAGGPDAAIGGVGGGNGGAAVGAPLAGALSGSGGAGGGGGGGSVESPLAGAPTGVGGGGGSGGAAIAPLSGTLNGVGGVDGGRNGGADGAWDTLERLSGHAVRMTDASSGTAASLARGLDDHGRSSIPAGASDGAATGAGGGKVAAAGGRGGGARHLGSAATAAAPHTGRVGTKGGGDGAPAGAAAWDLHMEQRHWGYRVADRRRARARALQRRRAAYLRAQGGGAHAGGPLPLPLRLRHSPDGGGGGAAAVGAADASDPWVLNDGDMWQRLLLQLQDLGQGQGEGQWSSGGNDPREGPQAGLPQGAAPQAAESAGAAQPHAAPAAPAQPLRGGGAAFRPRGSLDPHEDRAIPLIDTWSGAAVLIEGTWDGIHFANTGAVGLAQLSCVLHAICSESTLKDVAEAAAAAKAAAADAAAGWRG